MPRSGLLAEVHRIAPGDPAAAGRVGDAAVDGEIVKVQAEHAVVGGQDQQVQVLGLLS
jgi:hypothetical protein